MRSFDYITEHLRPEDFVNVVVDRPVELPTEKVFYHSGDFGDIIYALPAIRAMGGGKLFIGPSLEWKTRLAMTAAHVDVMRPLLELQPYIHGIEFCQRPPPEVNVNLNRFREHLLTEHQLAGARSRLHNLAEAHLYTFKLPLSECDVPWLTVDGPVAMEKYPVLIHRSARWLNPNFPWDKVMARHGKHAVFVGLRAEYNQFCKQWGWLPYIPTDNFLVLARLIAGCRLFIGNQSLPYALREGMKKESLLEVWPGGPNCVFNRTNALYGYGKLVYIPHITEPTMSAITTCPACGVEAGEAEGSYTKCSCGATYATSQPDANQIMLYYQSYADDHSHMRLPRTIDDVNRSGLRRTPLLDKLVERVASGWLLDVGSGWGAFLANARERGFSVYGVEVCHKAANFSANVLGIPTLCDELTDCAFKADMFDAVCFNHTLERIKDPARALAAAHYSMREGAVLFGLTPNAGSFAATELNEKWPWFDNERNFIHLTAASLTTMLERQGFTEISVTSQTGDYDLNALKKMIAAKLLPDEVVDDKLAALNADNRGEELVFFAVKRTLPR